MSVKRLCAAVVVLLVAFAAGTGNLIAVIDHYAQEAEYLLWLVLGG